MLDRSDWISNALFQSMKHLVLPTAGEAVVGAFFSFSSSTSPLYLPSSCCVFLQRRGPLNATLGPRQRSTKAAEMAFEVCLAHFRVKC